MGEKEQGEPKDRIPFLESSIPGRTGVGRGEAYLGKVRPTSEGLCQENTPTPHETNRGSWKS